MVRFLMLLAYIGVIESLRITKSDFVMFTAGHETPTLIEELDRVLKRLLTRAGTPPAPADLIPHVPLPGPTPAAVHLKESH
jgi:hypothetical protein